MPDATPNEWEDAMPPDDWDDYDPDEADRQAALDYFHDQDVAKEKALLATLPAPSTYKAATNGKAADDDGEEHTSYWPIDLRVLFEAGYEPQQPEFLTRDDGQPLLYRGKCHACNGEGESGKSWFMLIACLQCIRNGEHVLYLDYEDHARTTVTRLLALGATPDEVLGFLHYMEPLEAAFTRTANGLTYTRAHADLHTIMDRYTPVLVVVDGVTEAMWKHMLDPDKNGDFTLFHDNFTKPLAHKGAATSYIDHVTKDKETRGKYAIGGVHKFNVIDGAVFSFQPLTPFGVGQHGTTRINVQKDRPGELRQHTPDGKHIADLHLISDPDTHELTWEVRKPPAVGPAVRKTTLMEKASRSIEDLAGAGVETTGNAIAKDVGGTKSHVLDALRTLVDEGFVGTRPGAGKAKIHYTIRPYHQSEDPLSDRYENHAA